MTRRKAYKLLNINLLDKKIKLHRKRRHKNDVKFRLEYEGSFLIEFYSSEDDALLIARLNRGNCIYYKDGECIVYQLGNRVLCIAKIT